MRRAPLLILTIALISISAMAQKVQKSPKARFVQTVGTTDITVVYHRPGLKGRALESLITEGKVWRMGANEATEITFSKTIKISGKVVPAGTYSLYAIPGKTEWTIILNSKLSWGTQYNQENDILRFSGKTMTLNPATETFTINVSDISDAGTHANLELRWGKTMVKAPFEVVL